jgi:hypothetical protein
MDLLTHLGDLRRRRIDLSVIDGHLRFRSPKGMMTPSDREFLENNKSAILDILEQAADHGLEAAPTPLTSPGSDGRSDRARVPERQSDGPPGRPARRSSPTLSLPGNGHREARIDSHNSQNSRNPSPRVDIADFANIATHPGHALQEADDSAVVEYGVADRMVVRMGDRGCTYSVWGGQTLDGDRFGLDTETALARDNEVPELALASVSNGTVHNLIHPDRLGEFILQHRDRHFVFHNVAFDHRIIVKHLEARGETGALRAWWEIVDANRVHDTMHLDGLIRLGRTDANPLPRNLAVVAFEYAGLVVDKDDPFRLRYGEILGKDWATVERGFFEYAVRDPIATLAAYEAMIVEAAGIMASHGLDPVEVARQHGYLGENYQVKAAIALAAVTRIGIALDRSRVEVAEREHRDRIQGLVNSLITMPGCEGLFHHDRQGRMKLTQTGIPSFRQDRLRELLVERAGRVAAEARIEVPLARTPSGRLSLKESDWAPFAPFDPFIRVWLELVGAAKACQFFAGLQGSVVHPKYRVFVRTGRTGCSGPNIQQMPRRGGFRESFVARLGFVLLILDYRFIELRTLAAICEARFGRSRLAEVIRDGNDPHVYTAAMLAGMGFDDFKALASSDDPCDRARFDDLRQKAKPVNFGIPGGLGAPALVAYAFANYGVVMTLDEAVRFRDKLINEVYPELALYLADDCMETLARNLGTTVESCWESLDWKGDRSGAAVGGTRNVVAGKTCKADGKRYKKRYLDGVWGGLIALNRNPELAPHLASRQGSDELHDRLFRSGVTTLTGRVRGRVGFTQARNTPFQGLASDGAKLAIYELIRTGYRVVAFVHDEVVIELPEDVDHAAEARRVESIMNRAMESVTGNVPASCEYALCRRWSKKARAVFDGDGRLLPWEDGPS